MMHWIYLTLFVLVLLVPQLVPHDLSFIARENFESLAIFILGMIGFGFFQLRELEYKRHIADKRKYQKVANEASKDLVHSYSYIGEINRQLEILKNIALGLPESGAFTSERRKQTFDAILEAIFVFAHSEHFVLRFVNTRTKRLEEEMGMGNGHFTVSAPRLVQQKKEVEEIEGCSVVKAPRSLHRFAAYILIDRQGIAPEDVEFLRAIASQALFLFAWGREQEKSE